MELASEVKKSLEADKAKDLKANKAVSLEPIQLTVKMSPMFKNELFQAFALYRLVNGLGFPPDFFKINPNDSMDIRSLKKMFPNPQANFFAEHIEDNPFPNNFLEKTAILGLFWKSWFMQQLWSDKDFRANSFKSANPNTRTFLKAIEEYRMAKKNEQKDKGAALRKFKKDFAHFYTSNSGFFEALPLDKQKNEENKFSDYWMNKGFDKYVQSIFNENNPYARQLFGDKLGEFGIPFKVYNANTGLRITRNDCEQPYLPSLELLFNPDTNYVCLVQTVEDIHRKKDKIKKEILDEYNLQMENYEYAEIKSNSGSTVDTHTCLFLEAAMNPEFGPMVLVQILNRLSGTQPANMFPESPLVSDSEADSNSETETLSEEASTDSNSDFDSDSDSESIPTEESSSEESSDSQNEELSPEQQRFNEELDRFRDNLALLKGRATHYGKTLILIEKDTSLSSREKAEKSKEYQKALDAAKALYGALEGSFKKFNKSKKSEDDYNTFKVHSMRAISMHKPILKRHRDCDKIIANIIGAILGMVVLYAAVLAINYLVNGFHNTMWHSEGRIVVESIEDNIENLGEFCTP